MFAVVAALLMLTAGSARAATVYPPGGGAFSTGAEGWHTVGEPTCNITALSTCSARGGYDASDGNSPGSLEAETKILVNLGGIFKSTVNFESPNFTVTEGGAATLHLDRQLVSKSLLDLTPKAEYTVSLVDRSGGGSAEVMQEAISGNGEAFAGKSGAATLTSGHTYAIVLDTETSSSVADVGALGSTSLRFDNVALTVGTSNNNGNGGNGGNGGSGGKGGNGGKGASGANGLSDAKLLALFRKSSASTPVTLKGNRLFAKVNCPPKVGRACRITAQGMLSRGKAATTKRTVKVAKGKGKRIVLHVKPKALKKVAKRKRLLIEEKVRAGGSHATLFKSRKLIRRG